MIASILPINENYVDRSFKYLTYLLAIFPILPYGIRSVVTILWCLIGLDLYLKKRKKNSYEVKLNQKLFFITVLSFLYLSITLFYSENTIEGFKKLGQMSSLVVYPLIFFLNSNRFDEKARNNVVIIFCASVILLVLYQVIKSLYNLEFLLQDLNPLEIKRNNLGEYKVIENELIHRIKLRRFRNYVTGLVNVHTTYQGLWIAFVLFYLLKTVFSNFREYKKAKSIIMVLTAGMLFSWLLIMSTRMPVLAILLGSFITLLFFTNFSIKTYITIFGAVVLIAISSYLAFSTVQLRIDEVFKTRFALPSSGNDIENYNSTNVRNGVYFCSLKMIKENTLFGVGLGDAQDRLNDCYTNELNAKIYGWTTYNTHNQYLFFLLVAGPLGLLMFLVPLYITFKISIRRKENHHFYFLTVVAIICFTENLLVRSDGLIFFSFFNALFLFNPKYIENDRN